MSTQPSDLDDLTILGKKAKPSKTLETFPNRSPGRYYLVTLATDEFTCVCPATGQPDFADLFLEYVPDQKCVELKSLKLYLWSYRNEGAFHEKATNEILADLVALLSPRFLEIDAKWFVRGGITTYVKIEHRNEGWQGSPDTTSRPW